MVIIIVLYVLMGLFGYLRFGADVLGSITLNLPKNEMWEFSINEIIILVERLFLRKAQAVQGMLAFSIFITHGLACYVAIDITWNEYLAKRIQNNSSFWEYFTRTMLVFSTCKSTRVFIKWQQAIEFFYFFRQSCLQLRFQTWSCSYHSLAPCASAPLDSHFQHWFRLAHFGTRRADSKKLSWSPRIPSLQSLLWLVLLAELTQVLMK